MRSYAPPVSLPPEVLEPRRRQLAVAHRVLDRAMAQPILQRPCIMPCIRQSVAASMPEHVAVNRESEAGTLANALYQPIDRVGRERAARLGREDGAAVRELPAQLPECPDLVVADANGLPFLTRWTCSDADRPNSTIDSPRYLHIAVDLARPTRRCSRPSNPATKSSSRPDRVNGQ